MDSLHHECSKRRSSFPGLPASLFFFAVCGLFACYPALQLETSDHPSVLSEQLLEGPSPATPGPHEVLTLTYGSGADRNRPEYATGVAFATDSVDASKLIQLGDQRRSRNEYWGFTPKGFPLNARVWYPDGDGPFPLVLVVHGNHNPQDFSDPGYDYLGELLASRGYILASVDMNFVNGGIRGENDARGWLLLKHLEVWKGFNDDPENPFYQRVDMSNLAVMGHSRGGEAVAHAAAFNRLSRYPDDASLTFDFNFDLKTVIAIAPVDGQYLPTDRYGPLENVNYLVFHGSHDGDVTSFHGIRMYNRLRFTDGAPWMKAAIYVYRANHGQWNTVWNNKDNGPRSQRILDLRGLLEPEEQRSFAEIYVSAFLDATLKGDERWRPIFRDHRVIGGWLPETMYITRFEDATFRPLATFEEDIDVTTGTAAGVTLRGDSLSQWKEGVMLLRSRNRTATSSSQVNQAVWLGWNNQLRGSDESGPPGAFVISLPDTLGDAWGLSDGASLKIDLTATNDTPGPRAPPDSAEVEGPESSDATEPGAEEDPVDLTVQVVDGEGRTASVALSAYGPVRRPLETHVLRRGDLEDDRFPQLFELLLQSYDIPLSDFRAQTPGLDLSTLTEIRLVFDRLEAGTVVVDQIGFSFLDEAYTRVRIPSR